MTQGAQVKVRGADRVASTMRTASSALADMSEANKSAATALAEVAKANAPKRSGALARTIVPSWSRTQALVVAGASIRYAGVQEGGWRLRGIQPRRYVGRAVDSTENKVDNTYVSAVETIVGKIRGV